MHQVKQLPTCPYCDTEYHIWEDCNDKEVSGHEDGETIITCSECERKYLCITHVQYHFTSKKQEGKE